MARIYHRPTTVNDYGNVQTVGGGNVLGDNSNGTYKRYSAGNEGSVGVFPNLNPSALAGKPILAVRVGHVERQGGLYNGWPMSYLRIEGQRYEPSKLYIQDGFSQTWREKFGPPVYKGKNQSWTVDDIDKMSADIAGAHGNFGPVKGKIWCLAAEVFILVVTAEPLTTPATSTLASYTTSNPALTASATGIQPEQSSMATFQVARDNSFTDDVRNYHTSYISPAASGSTTWRYQGSPGAESYADLGPGTWYIRTRLTDITGQVSQWSPVRSFTITFGALPVPRLTAPSPSSTSTNPLMIRSAYIEPVGTAQFFPGDRALGVEWEFSSGSTVVATWKNVVDGIFRAGTVSYDPSPAAIEPGLYGGRVSPSDPDQKLPQGVLTARVRAVDKWGNVGAWSANSNVTISHKPFARNVTPTGGEDFDPVVNPFAWEFADPWSGDRQTAYKLDVLYGGSVIATTGTRYSTSTSTTVDIPSAHLGRVLSYELILLDGDGVASAEPTSSTFKYRRAPIVTVNAPAGQIDDGLPTVTWSNVFSESKIQSKVRVIVHNKTAGTVAYDSGTVVTADNFHKVSKQLANMSEFEVRVYVYDSGNLMGLGRSNFSTNFVLPPTLRTSVLADNYSRDGYVDVFWSGDIDPFFFEYRIYRRMFTESGDGEWKFSGSTQNSEHNSFRDYMASGHGEIEYAVTQVSYRFGSTVESLKVPELMSRVFISSEDYWLIIPGRESESVKLYSVTDDSFTDRSERSSYQIVGGGARVIRGSGIGMEGQLSCRIRASTPKGASDQVALLRGIGDVRGHVIMRDPFGNATRISIGDLSVRRIPGVGNSEFADIEVPYTEVR